jgi:hypothetical protein
MDNSKEQNINSETVKGFVDVCEAYCDILEQFNEYTKEDFLKAVNPLLAGMYLGMINLPRVESLSENFNEKFVREEDYDFIYQGLLQKLGQHDVYLEVFLDDMKTSEEPLPDSLSENLTDVYQDVKDFVMLYNLGTDEVMNDAVWEVTQNFEEYWGQKLVNAQRAIHWLLFKVRDLEENEDDQPVKKNEIDTSDWFITRRQQEFRDDGEEI